MLEPLRIANEKCWYTREGNIVAKLVEDLSGKTDKRLIIYESMKSKEDCKCVINLIQQAMSALPGEPIEKK